MRRAIAVGLIGLGLTCLSARPASAQWAWFRYIQQLSGPGPFDLQGVTVTFGCKKEDKQPGERDTADPGPAAYRYVFCDKAQGWEHVTRYMGVTFATGDGENNLVFPASREKLDRVDASIYLVTGAFRLHPGVDVGSSAGFMRFTATPDLVVSKFVIDPFIAVRPVGLFLDRDRPSNKVASFFGQAIEVIGGVIIFPQGFRLTDFGAIGGPDWTGDPEMSGHIGFRFSVVF
jgi:hypothetical protein